jgi:hypothetical protein
VILVATFEQVLSKAWRSLAGDRSQAAVVPMSPAAITAMAKTPHEDGKPADPEVRRSA